MPIPAGRLSDKIEFELKTFTTINADAVGPGAAHLGSWAYSFTEWAQATILSETSAQFVIRYRSAITPATHRILFNGSYWTIIDPVPDQRRTILTITCTFERKIDVTHLQSTEREFIDGLPVSRDRSE